MKETTLDCTGLPCPQPVLKTKKCIENEKPERIVVVVDNAAAHENVTRFLASCNYLVDQNGDSSRVSATAPNITGEDATSVPMTEEEIMASCPVSSGQAETASPAKVVAFITADTLGKGDDTLGGKLMQNFLLTLPELGSSLWRVILVNSGVKLTVEGAEALAPLQALEESGVELLVCGTCLDFFSLLEKKKVGTTTNMLDVVTSLALATKVIQV